MSDPPAPPPPEAMLSDLDVRRIARAVCDEMEERERLALIRNLRAADALLAEQRHRDPPPDGPGPWVQENHGPWRRATEEEIVRFGLLDG